MTKDNFDQSINSTVSRLDCLPCLKEFFILSELYSGLKCTEPSITGW